MSRLIGAKFLLGLALAAASALGQKAGVQQAVRWERAKDAAAARQANLYRSSTPDTSKPASTSKSAEASKTTAHQDAAKDGAQETARWERSRDPGGDQPEKTGARQGNGASTKSKKKK